jgi:hypothetical protein
VANESLRKGRVVVLMSLFCMSSASSIQSDGKCVSVCVYARARNAGWHGDSCITIAVCCARKFLCR